MNLKQKQFDYLERAVIEIEGSCNLSCTMCPQKDGRGDFNAKISLPDYKRLIDECYELGTKVVQLDGSGEATLCEDLPKYIEYASKKGIKVQIYSNGVNMKGDYMKRCVDSGLHLFRFSVNGWDIDSYKAVTGFDYFRDVLLNAFNMQVYAKDTIIASYHLVNPFLSSATVYDQIQQYRMNFIELVDSSAEIWKLHNWAGMFDTVRVGEKRTCGRPNAPEITIRANRLAVVPCCQTLGRDAEAVLGYCDNMSVYEVYNSEQYNWLRKMHDEERFDEITVCKDCDFLNNDESVLVWTNKSTGKLNQMNSMDFIL